jgi:pimeloyl-ACP methyl ester carboxylesterase
MVSRIVRMIFAIFAAAVMSECTKDDDPTQPASHYIRKSDSDNVIVFVHGIFGNSVETWTTGTNYWPEMLSKDNDFEGSDIYVLQYPTKPDTTFSIDELSESMRLRLRDAGIENKKRIVFLTHSMGGLVARAYLLKYRAVAERVSFMYFFSTPTTGSQLASLAAVASSNPQLVKMKVNISTDYLGDLLRQWLAAGFQFPTYCAYEKRKTFGIEVVTFESGSALCNKALDPIDADHLSIVKPSDKNAESYVAFKAAFQQSGRRVENRFKQLAENIKFGGTTLEYAKSLLGQPIWERDGVAKFEVEDHIVFIEYQDNADSSKKSILGIQAEPRPARPGSTVLALSAPFNVEVNGTRLGVSGRPLGSAKYSDFGVLDRVGLDSDPFSNPLRCSEIYRERKTKSEIGVCCFAVGSPGVGTVMTLWTYVDMPENWAPVALQSSAQKLVAQLAINDDVIIRLRKNWVHRTDESYCERQYLSQSEEEEVRKQSFREVPDSEIVQTLHDMRVDGIGYFGYKIGAAGSKCRGMEDCEKIGVARAGVR